MIPVTQRLALNDEALSVRFVRAAAALGEFVHPTWMENIRELEDHFLSDFDMGFVNHPRINGTMVFTDRDAHGAEWPFVEAWRSPDILGRYAGTGLNAPFLEGKLKVANVMNSVHQLHHLGRFERFRGKPVEEIRTVVEFGGGYGNMARLFRNFGNLSRYVIIDLPLFSCIQYVYLATVGGPGAVRLVGDTAASPAEGTIELAPITRLPDVRPNGALFLSTWALSECPAPAYDYVRAKGWFGAEELLLSFHEGWKPWDTDRLHAELRNTFGNVAVEPLPFLPGNQYLFAGKRIATAAAE